MAVAEAGQHGRAGRRWLVAPGQLLAGLDQREALRRVDAERLEHLARQHLAQPAFESQPAITEPAVGGLPRSLGTKVEQPAKFVPQLREQEAASVADVGIVGAKLVPVIAQGQRPSQVAGERLEPSEMPDPARVIQVQPDALRPRSIGKPQDALRKIGRVDRVVESAAKLQNRLIGKIGLRLGHRPAIGEQANRGKLHGRMDRPILEQRRWREAPLSRP